MKARLPVLWAGLPALLLTACVDNHESVTVQTTAGPTAVPGAECQLENHKGTWLVTTPGSVFVHLGSEDLDVKCTKDGYVPAEDEIKSSVNMEGVLLDGAIQSTVSGAAWLYPQMITVPMQPAPVAPAPPSANVPVASN